MAARELGLAAAAAAAAQLNGRAISNLEKDRNSKFSWMWSVPAILACEAEA